MSNPCSSPCPSPCLPSGVIDPRVIACFTRRFNAASSQAAFASGPHTANTDESLGDKCGTYSKCLKQDSYGKVNLAAYNAFRTAISNADFAALQALTLGGKRTLNGPMGAWAYAFMGADGSQFGDLVVPPAPTVDSEAYATELIELYWASLLRDVPFSEYPTNKIAIDAAKELSGRADYAGPRDPVTNHVTAELLFRGGYAGETTGPYMSQFLITPTNFGAADFPQKYTTYMPGVDYMTDLQTWFAVQNGIGTGLMDQKDPTPRYLHNGRGLAAFTHVDELYQSYFTAYLVLDNMATPPYNPANPYANSKTQNGFGTFGGPDIASTLAQVAKIALNSVWYQKWVVHLRHRPEAAAGLVHLIKTGLASFDATPAASVLDSEAVKRSHHKYGTYLLSQAFPEGSPAHPAYPTGHGAVAGACITILKFFFDGNAPLNQLVPTTDGNNLVAWDPSSGTGFPGITTVNGELHKLAHNVSFGHGIHAGIHWRSDTDSSIALGEQVGLRFLKDLACSYPEPVSIPITLIDGVTTVTITNQ